MIPSFADLNDRDLQNLITALGTGRVVAPYSLLQIGRVLSGPAAAAIQQSLQALDHQGFSSSQILTVLQVIKRDRSSKENREPPVELVISGPEAPGCTNRETSVVVRELFAHANKSVLVVGYAVYQGASVFEALAHRMEKIIELDVKFFLNIARKDNDATPANIIVSRFTREFRDKQWPKGCRYPQVFFDPRSIAENKRSSLHAKCVVVDASTVFVSSANFTKAAQERNIEVGLKIESPWLAQRIIRHFELLYEYGLASRAL